MKRDPGQVEPLLPAAFGRQDRGRCAREADLALYASGELEPEERRAFETHLAECSDCRSDLAELGSTRAVWDGAGSAPRLRRWWAAAAAAALAGSVAALVLTVRTDRGGDRLRAMGAWQLQVGVQRGGETFRAAEGVRLQTGDRLGFFYTASQPGYLAVLYVDEKGEVVQLSPSGEPRRVEPGTELPLPDGALLSPGAGCEWVVGMFSPEPVSREAVRGELARMWRERVGCRLAEPRLAGAQVRVLGVRR